MAVTLTWLLYTVVCLLVGSVIVKLYPSFITYCRQWYHLRSLQFLPFHPLLGNLPVLNDSEESIHYILNIILQRKLELGVMWYGPMIPCVECFRPDTIKIVLKEDKSDQMYRLLVPWLGRGLLIANGDKWFRSRRLLTPAFHFGVLKPYVQVYNECAQILMDKWTNQSISNKPVEICEPVSLLTLDVVLRCAFSYKSNCQDPGIKTPYVSAIGSLGKLVSQRIQYPLHLIDFLFYLSPSGREFNRVLKVLHDHSEKVIRDRKTVLEEQVRKGEPIKPTNGRKYLDFLDVLLTSKDEDGVGLSDEQIRAEVDTFMFEGHDTTASGISWTLYCLAKYPVHQEKCREEIWSILNGRDTFEWDDLKSLSYTTMCIKESMRLNPPVPHYFRNVSEDTIIKGHLIPKGTMVGINALELHYQPDLWENPKVFDPLRFLPERCDERDSFTYMPFSAGPRNCIGQTFALNEERIVISSILNKFSLELDEDHPVEWVSTMILRAKHGIKLKLKPLTT
ncbi:cytochrome P450 4F4-like [Dysidea avara]|uniref:cytochrome P450 4F4-like n=1 Tax=Dysidea avara TaxID=196820 RepID=UPI00332340CD